MERQDRGPGRGGKKNQYPSAANLEPKNSRLTSKRHYNCTADTSLYKRQTVQPGSSGNHDEISGSAHSNVQREEKYFKNRTNPPKKRASSYTLKGKGEKEALGTYPRDNQRKLSSRKSRPPKRQPGHFAYERRSTESKTRPGGS